MTEAVRQGGDELSGAALTTVASSLRWSRPDLTAGLAAHAADVTAEGDPVWLLASGWRVHGVAATGDARGVLAEVFGAVRRRAVDPGAADGLRLLVEVAGSCQDNGDSGVARRLAERVLAGAGGSAELRLDARLVLIRCALAVSDSDLDGDRLLAEARADAEVLPGVGPTMAVSLATAAVARAAGRAREAVAAAEEGLRQTGPIPTPHLTDALAAQRISGLIELGRTAEAGEAARAAVTASRLTAPSRQAAQLQLVVAQATADDADATGRALAEAADQAAAVDVPGLEAACRTALAELAERGGALDVALREMRAGMGAEQRDKGRGRRHRELVAEFERGLGAARGARQATVGPSPRSAETLAVVASTATEVQTSEQPAAPASPAGALSAIDALLGSFDTAGAIGATPLASPVPDRSADTSAHGSADPSANSSADASAGSSADVPAVEGAADPVSRVRRRARATAVLVDEDSSATSSYGALLGDALISELRASGRWSDEGAAGAWPRLARERDRDAVIDTDGSDAAAESGAGPVAAPALDDLGSDPLGRSEPGRRSDRPLPPEAGETTPGGRAARRRAVEAASRAPSPTPRRRDGEPVDESSDRTGASRDDGSESGAAVAGDLSGAATPSSHSGDTSAADEWLRSTLADLDRAWGRPPAGPASDAGSYSASDTGSAARAEGRRDAESAESGGAHQSSGAHENSGAHETMGSASATSPRTESAPTAGRRRAADAGERAAVGASVVIDLVQETQRLRTRQAERVIRDLTDRMRVHLPRRGRIRDEDPATLQVDLPGRDRAECAAWMHPVIRDLATAVAGAMALDPIGMGGVTAFRLRGTVYGTDGRAGVRLIQEIPEPGSESAWDSGPRIDDLAGRPGGRRRHRRSAEPADEEDDSDPGSVGAPSTEAQAVGGVRTGAHAVGPASNGGQRGGGTAPNGAGSGGAASNGAGAGGAAADEARSASSTGPGEGTDPEEKLGLGDLLAGAMAAYRGL